MKVKEIRDMTEAELNAKLVDLKSELFNLRFQHATNQLDNPMRLVSLKNEIGTMAFKIPYYEAGLLILFRSILGRAVCGFLCPMGWIQEIIALVPVPKKNRFKADKPLRKLKYLVLAATLILPFFVARTPFFCKYICPSGTTAALFLAAADRTVWGMLGSLFSWKLAVLITLVILSLFIWRPFCKYICPLGAFYGFFNRFALYRGSVDESACTRCGKCASVCRMGVDPVANINSMECIRCGDCARTCPAKAIHLGFTAGKNKETGCSAPEGGTAAE